VDGEKPSVATTSNMPLAHGRLLAYAKLKVAVKPEIESGSCPTLMMYRTVPPPGTGQPSRSSAVRF
jgi:hypothetical protein